MMVTMMVHKVTPVIALFQFLLLQFSTIAVVRACSPQQGTPRGPYIKSPYALAGDEVLRTTTTDRNSLWTTISLYDSSSSGRAEKQVNALLNLQTGAVTRANPGDVELTPRPEPLVDPTGGYSLFVQGSTATLSPTVDPNQATITVSLEAPDLFALKNDTESYYFFVSASTEKAYILYETVLDCKTTATVMAADGGNTSSSTAAIMYDGCVKCPTCTYRPSRAAIVNLTSPDAGASVVFSDFDYSSGIYLDNPGPSNSLTTVWDDIQIAQLGARDSCGGTGYFWYTPDSVGQARFGEAYLGALAHRGDGARTLTAYAISQDEAFITAGEYEQVVERFVTAYTVTEFQVATGETLYTVELDQLDVRAVVSSAPDDDDDAPATSAPSPPAPAVVAVPLPEPTLESDAPSDAPSRAPSDSLQVNSTALKLAPFDVLVSATIPDGGVDKAQVLLALRDDVRANLQGYLTDKIGLVYENLLFVQLDNAPSTQRRRRAATEQTLFSYTGSASFTGDAPERDDVLAIQASELSDTPALQASLNQSDVLRSVVIEEVELFGNISELLPASSGSPSLVPTTLAPSALLTNAPTTVPSMTKNTAVPSIAPNVPDVNDASGAPTTLATSSSTALPADATLLTLGILLSYAFSIFV